MRPHAVAHFDIVGQLGAGGMGVVYRARDRVLGRLVALKVVRPERAGDEDARRRFLREARAAAILSHPGIAAIYEAGEAPPDEASGHPQLYIAEELVEGETLAQRLERGPLPVPEAVAIGVQVAEALAAAHAHGIVHRDIKPSNLALTPEGHVKVLDFGIARTCDVSELPTGAGVETALSGPPTLTSTLAGTPGYMAPEQLTGGVVDARVDVYATGCVLYELLAGHQPFTGTSAAVLWAVLSADPPPLTGLRADVPPALAAVIERALARDPQQRYQSAAGLARALQEAGGQPVDASRPSSPGRRGRRVARAAAWALVPAGLAAVIWLAAARLESPALAFQERDFALVADVVNGTSEPVFDVALKSAIETDLRQSRYVNVFDATQVQNTLQMMRQPADVRIDQALGIDLCRRTGARALVVPGIVGAGTAYVLRAALIEPSTGRVVDEVRATAESREEVLLSAIDDLTRQLRRRLGESIGSIATTDPPFAQYTTSSLEALRLLGLGQRAWGAGDLAKAERCFREALEHDARFPAARGSLGLVLIQFAGRPEQGKKEIARALADAGDVSPRESTQLRAVHKQFVAGDLEGALEDYRLISDLYPDWVGSYNNSGHILQQLGRSKEAAAMYERAHVVDPHSLVPLWNVWRLYVNQLRDARSAERVGRTLVTLLPDNAHAAHTVAWALVGERRFLEAEEAMRAVVDLDAAHPYARPNLAHLQFRRGAVAEAAAAYRQLVAEGAGRTGNGSGNHAALCLAIALDAAGQAEEGRQIARNLVSALRAAWRTEPPTVEGEAFMAAALVAAGQHEEARRLAGKLESRAAAPPARYELARVYSLAGETDRAATWLERAFAAGYGDPFLILIDPPLGALRDHPVIDRLLPPPNGPDSNAGK